jgi:DNA-binding phage protein
MSDDESTIIDVHPAVTTMANMINYLTVSLYQGQFKYNHEQAWARLNEIYDCVSKTPTIAPSLENIQRFYDNVATLWFVTETDDPDYERYIRQLRRQIAAADAAAEVAQLKEMYREVLTESIRAKNR